MPITGDPEQPARKIFQSDVECWRELYPGVDVLQQLRQMRAWLDANPRRRKTGRGIKNFIVTWLGKEQNRARASPAMFRTFGAGGGSFRQSAGESGG